MQRLDYISLTWRPVSGPDAPPLIPQGLSFLFSPSLFHPGSASHHRHRRPPPFGLLLFPPWEMLADWPPQQIKQAAAPQGRCRGQAMQSLMFFMSAVEEQAIEGR